jgi:NAD(P)-dependent dehydrogenase (short-subunit alcohol dehydrogenase family)
MSFPDGVCYICRVQLPPAHGSYPNLCHTCGDLNYGKRRERADLTGYTALVTGGRVKIGFEIAVRLLRWGAHVIVTSRFAVDAADRFAQHPDHGRWADRLSIYPADFRVLASVEDVIHRIHNGHSKLDILINNAAQTLRRPPAFYRHILGPAVLDKAPEQSVVAPGAASWSPHWCIPRRLDADSIAALSQVPLAPGDELSGVEFPDGALDKDGQQEDRRETNSWMLTLADVPPVEFLETLYVNTVAPFLLCSRLKPLMRRSGEQRRSFIVNVTAMEGNFFDPDKNSRHPHTNMAKAALNMMTRTCAADYAADRIMMTSVDPGWITNERPFPLSQNRSQRRFKMAIDEADGAARVCDPIARSVNGLEHLHGVLLKNYASFPW